MTEVCWVRHGENVANVSRTLSHRAFDAELTERGRRQVETLATVLAEEHGSFGAVWCSPLRRARQSAEILCQRLGLTITGTLEELREVDVGELDGCRDGRSWATYEDVVGRWRLGDRSARFPGGEDGHELAARIVAALRGIACSTGPGRALVVAHGGNLRAALPVLAGVPDPGRNMPTATAARLLVDSVASTPCRLLHWPDEGGSPQPSATAGLAPRPVEGRPATWRRRENYDIT